MARRTANSRKTTKANPPFRTQIRNRPCPVGPSLLSLALAGFMVGAVGLTIDAYMDRINPWTTFLYLATPPAVVLVAGLLVLGFFITGDRPERTLSSTT